MSKNWVLISAVAGLLGGFAQFANAADLEPAPVPAPVLAPAVTWTGCYMGVHAGVGGLSDDYTASVSTGLFNPLTGAPATNQTQWGIGVLGGAQGGCDYQFGHLVVGFQSEAWWSSLETQANFSTPGFAVRASTTNPWDFDLTARVGYALDQALLYGKAGAVWGEFNYNFASFTAAQAGNAVSTGLLFGLGLEYALTPQWTVFAEGDAILFSAPNVNLACNFACAGPPATTASISAFELLLKLGANYRFNFGPSPPMAINK